ncbi:protein mahjong [Ostrinia nubilalis]|uniref:protein mahjong n=1 Tax=Ostrinia nubilalis TaxID=29057 RepID=UPI0030825BB6
MDSAPAQEVTELLRQWEEQHQSANYDPIPTLTRIAEIIEAETENFMKKDPDPFDERHPSRTDPECALGHALKVMFKKDNFMTKLVNDYVRDTYYSRQNITGRDVLKLNIAACRLTLDLMPGLEMSVVFQDNESLIHRLVNWATNSPEPLQCYATGLLAAAMEVQEIATNFRDLNAMLVPRMLKRLHELRNKTLDDKPCQNSVTPPSQTRHFARFDKKRNHDHNGRSNGPAPDKRGTVALASSVTPPSQTRHFARFDKKRNHDHNGRSNGPAPDKRGTNSVTPPSQTRHFARFDKKRNHDHNGRSNGPAPDKRGTNSVTPPSQTRHFARFDKKRNHDHNGRSNGPAPDKRDRDKDEGGGGDMLVEDAPHPRDPETPVKNFSNSSNAACSPEHWGMMSPPPRPPPPAPLPHETSSNSSWAEMETYVIGNIQIHPPTDATKQMLILRYLTPMGEYQEFLSHVFEQNALGLILGYLNVRESRDSRLAFEALKYLAALLCHKKFSIDFINMGGLQKFLEVPRPSVAATGVSICLYYLAYCEDAMERVCLLPRSTLADLVKYALWLLECSHDSGRCHATMFFGLSFQFRVILEEFDYQDGLRKLYNVISTLPILGSDDEEMRVSDDETCAARQIVRHVCVATRRYLEAHLRLRAAQVARQQGDNVPEPPPYKASKSSPEEIQEQIELLQSVAWSRWAPVDELVELGGISLLLQVVGFAYEWNFNGRSETVRSALDVVSVCCVAPRVQLLLTEKIDMRDADLTTGVNIVLGAADGEIVAEPEVQKAALNVLVNCVCAPVHRAGTSTTRFSLTGPSKKKTALRSYEDVIQKVWESVRTNNGIMVLLSLMMVKAPITDADRLRGLACRALAGLARCPTVRQIISKLPLFTTSQIQVLMRDPILQEKRQEHVMFQKYALELLERVSGKSKHMGAEFETSLANIHRANVVAQTRINYNERQLLQLVAEHLLARGLLESAATLQREAGLPPPAAAAPAPPPPPVYTPSTPVRPRLSASRASSTGSLHRDSLDLNHHHDESSPQPHVIKLRVYTNRKLQSQTPALSTPISSASEHKRSLQKQMSVATDTTQSQHRITLHSIITEYLYNQHALCKNPVVTCPQFNLFHFWSGWRGVGEAKGASEHKRSLQKQMSVATDTTQSQHRITLHSIITEYLYNQHALCKNPVVTCPQFNLFHFWAKGASEHKRSLQKQMSVATDTTQSQHRITLHSIITEYLYNQHALCKNPVVTCPQFNLFQGASEYKRSLQKQMSVATDTTQSQHRITLHSIITEYLYNQHALCKNPVVTCPQFNLFQPHKCPDPRSTWSVLSGGCAASVCARVSRRELGYTSGCRRADARLVHSHFAPVRTLRLQDDDAYFTHTIFHPTQHQLLAATSSGDIRIFNLFSGVEESSYQVHDTLHAYICHMQASRDGLLLLASTPTTWRPLSALWNMKEFEQLFQLDNEEYVEFSKMSDERIIGTRGETATIFDTRTGSELMTLTPAISNQYAKNRATFNPTDELVLSDGVLWDVNSGKEIHKFDKLNQTHSGVFHPNGLEVISNTEVWDLRTFHLLRTVPTLDKSEVIFNPTCTALYAVCSDQDSEERSQFDTSFKTLDPFDYSSIATIDVKRNIYSLSVSRWGTQISLVENMGDFDQVQESCVKVYDVGRKRDHDDDAEEDEEEELAGGSENDDGSSSPTDAEDELAIASLRDAVMGFRGGSSGSSDDEPEARPRRRRPRRRAAAADSHSSDSDGENLDLPDIIEFELD